MPSNNYLTIDFERLSDRDIYKGINLDKDEEYTALEISLDTILQHLDDFNNTATFFAVGEIIRDYPNLIKKIKDKGHEVGIHGWIHRRLDEINYIKFQEHLRKCITSYVKTLHLKPIGFRAPQFSMGNQTNWAIRTLVHNGFLYDSSLYPCGMDFYGGNSGPIHPYHPSEEDLSVTTENGTLMEFPVLVYKNRGIRVPLGGGFWVRLFGSKVLSAVISRLNNQGYPATVYFHNWEFIDNEHWVKDKSRNYRNLGIPIKREMWRLLSPHKFTHIKSYFQDKSSFTVCK